MGVLQIPLGLGVAKNPLIFSPFVNQNEEGNVGPPVPGDRFLLTDESSFLLTDDTYLLLAS